MGLLLFIGLEDTGDLDGQPEPTRKGENVGGQSVEDNPAFFEGCGADPPQKPQVECSLQPKDHQLQQQIEKDEGHAALAVIDDVKGQVQGHLGHNIDPCDGQKNLFAPEAEEQRHTQLQQDGQQDPRQQRDGLPGVVVTLPQGEGGTGGVQVDGEIAVESVPLVDAAGDKLAGLRVV